MEGDAHLPSHLGGAPPSNRSFREVLAGKSLELSPKSSSYHGKPALIFSDEQIASLAAPFAFTLVGKFPSRRPPMEIIRYFFVRLKLSGAVSVSLLDYHHISIKLANDLDYARVFSRRSYYIAKCQMGVLKWSPSFDIREESPIVPIWIAMPNLRLHFFSQPVLFAIGSMFGRPLLTDNATAALSRPSVARVLVELDISKHHPCEVWLGSDKSGYFQKIVFENMPLYCSHCLLHGHGVDSCLSLHPNLGAKKSANLEIEVVQPVLDLIPSSLVPSKRPPDAVLSLDSSQQIHYQPNWNLFQNLVVNPPTSLAPVLGDHGAVISLEMRPECSPILIQQANDVVDTQPILSSNSGCLPEIPQVCSQPPPFVVDCDVIPSPPDLGDHSLLPHTQLDFIRPELAEVPSKAFVLTPSLKLAQDQFFYGDVAAMELQEKCMKELGLLDNHPAVSDIFERPENWGNSECIGFEQYQSEPSIDDFIKVRKKKRGKNKIHVKTFRITRASGFSDSMHDSCAGDFE